MFPRDVPILEKRLKNVAEKACLRKLTQRRGVDFSSNDYLGFSQDPELRKRILQSLHELPMGSTGSRLLRGNLPIYEETEESLAEFCGAESALLYATGYQANLGVLSALLTTGDRIYSDQLNHASLIDAIRLSGAKKRIYPHLNYRILREYLEQDQKDSNSSENLKIILTESIFSMDGDQADLRQLTELAEEFSALLIVDEAHATGLWGNFSENKGGGLVQALGLTSHIFATLHPAGKAMGLSGAWVCGSAQLKEYLVNFSRAFIFSTASTPWLAQMLKESIQFWREKGRDRAVSVLERSRVLQDKLNEVVLNKGKVPKVLGPIIPLILGENEKSLQWAERLQKEGLDVRAIRPPTVPEGQARLRLTVNYLQTVQDIDRLAHVIKYL